MTTKESVTVSNSAGSMTTLLISTMNRSQFVERQLRYYANIGFDGQILIGDSSNADHVGRTKKIVEEVADQIQIDYTEYPHLTYAECLQTLLDRVSTKYAAVLPDDDFTVPRGLERSVQFLEENPEYVACQGAAVILTLESGGAYGKVQWLGRYNQRSIEGANATERLIDHLCNYSVTLFALYRVEAWRDMFRDLSSIEDRTFGGELLPCCLSVILGKVKKLDSLYLVRQDHPNRNFLPNVFDWITRGTFTTCRMIRGKHEMFRSSIQLWLLNCDGRGTAGAGHCYRD